MSYFNREFSFPGLGQNAPVTVSLNTSTRVLTVTPVGSYFIVYVEQYNRPIRYVKNSAVDFLPFTNTSGMWYFYFDSAGNAITTQNEWTDFHIVSPIYRIYWDSTLNGGLGGSVQELLETHTNSISADDHLWKHTHGVLYVGGFDIFQNKLTSGIPNIDGRNTCISLNTGAALDDNLLYTVTNSTGGLTFQQDMGDVTVSTTSPNNTNAGIFPVVYLNSTGVGTMATGTRFPFLFHPSSNNPQYYTAAGALISVNSSNFFNVFIYSIQDVRTGKRVRAYTYPVEYTSTALASVATWYDCQRLFPEFLEDHEARPLYRLIYEYRSTYTAGCKYCALRDWSDIKRITLES